MIAHCVEISQLAEQLRIREEQKAQKEAHISENNVEIVVMEDEANGTTACFNQLVQQMAVLRAKIDEHKYEAAREARQ